MVRRFPAAGPLFIGSREVISSRTTCALAAVALEASAQARRNELTRAGLIRYLHSASAPPSRINYPVTTVGRENRAAHHGSRGRSATITCDRPGAACAPRDVQR